MLNYVIYVYYVTNICNGFYLVTKTFVFYLLCVPCTFIAVLTSRIKSYEPNQVAFLLK